MAPQQPVRVTTVNVGQLTPGSQIFTDGRYLFTLDYYHGLNQAWVTTQKQQIKLLPASYHSTDVVLCVLNNGYFDPVSGVTRIGAIISTGSDS